MSTLKKFNLLIIVSILILTVFMGVFAAYRNNLLAQLVEQAESDSAARHEEWEEQNNSNLEQDSTSEGEVENIHFDTFNEIYSAWENILKDAKSIEMIGVGNIDGHCVGTLGPISVDADVSIQNNITQKKDKYGNKFLGFHYVGDEMFGFSTTFNNRYYYDANKNNYTIAEWEYKYYNVPVSKYLSSYGYEAPGMLYIINGNVKNATDLVKTSTGYTCTTVMDIAAAKNYINFMHKMNMVNMGIDYKALTIDWEFFSDGTLKTYTVREEYRLSVNYGPASGYIDCSSHYVVNVGNINRNVYIAQL